MVPEFPAGVMVKTSPSPSAPAPQAGLDSGVEHLQLAEEASVIILFDGEKEVFDSIDFRQRFISMPF